MGSRIVKPRGRNTLKVMTKKAKTKAANLSKYNRILKGVAPYITSFAEDDVNLSDHFKLALKAAFIKAYELCVAATQGDPLKDFFVITGLRGVCEDYIAFRFISKMHPLEKAEIVKLKVQEEVFKSSIAQWDFFRENHANQILYYQPDFPKQLDDVQTKLKSLMGVHLKGKKATMPTVFYMAEQTNLIALYKYLYHASSSLVHFNPRMLLRMGWGDLPGINFSVSNFTVYYQQFGLFYSVYLFRDLLCFLNEEGFATEIASESKALTDLLNKENRWPELVTFEEMNIGTLAKLLSFKAPGEPTE